SRLICPAESRMLDSFGNRTILCPSVPPESSGIHSVGCQLGCHAFHRQPIWASGRFTNKTPVAFGAIRRSQSFWRILARSLLASARSGACVQDLDDAIGEPDRDLSTVWTHRNSGNGRCETNG